MLLSSPVSCMGTLGHRPCSSFSIDVKEEKKKKYKFSLSIRICVLQREVLQNTAV